MNRIFAIVAAVAALAAAVLVTGASGTNENVAASPSVTAYSAVIVSGGGLPPNLAVDARWVFIGDSGRKLDGGYGEYWTAPNGSIFVAEPYRRIGITEPGELYYWLDYSPSQPDDAPIPGTEQEVEIP